MAVTQNSYIGNGSTTNYSFTFPYLKTADVKAQIDATVTTAFTLANATTVQFNTAPANGAKIKIYRETDDSALNATFYAGSALKSEDLNDNFTQNLYSTQEVTARYLSNLGGTMVGDMTMAEDVDIIFEGATDDAYETRLTVADPTADRTITLPNETGTVLTTGSSGAVSSAMIADGTIVAGDLASDSVTTAKITDANVTTAKLAADAVTGAKIADNAVDSEHYVDDSIDTAHISANAITATEIAGGAITTAKVTDDAITQAKIAASSISSTELTSNAVTTAKITDDAITQAKIADNSIGNAQMLNDAVSTAELVDNAVTNAKMADSSIGTAELVNDAVTADKIADGAVTSAKFGDNVITNAKLADNAVTTTEIQNNAVTTAKIASDNITSALIADNQINSEHYVDESIDREHLAADIIDGTKIADEAINSEHYVDASIDHIHLANDVIDGDNIQDNAVNTEHIAANAVTDSEIATGTLDNRYYTETELTDGALDGRYYTETESDARYFNISTGDTIKDGDTFPDNDTTIATTAAINDRIIDLIDDVGGFVPIANETSFPNANPDVNNGAGTIVSIGALASNHNSNGSGVITISNGTVGNSTVTITGAANSTTYSAGYGMLLETTTTLNTYTFHRLSSKATEVTTVAGSISNVNTVAGSISNINSVAGNATNINAVAADATDIGAVAGKATEIGLLGTADAIADMNTLGTTAIVSDLDTLADISSNITTVAGISSNVTTVAGISSNVTTVATNNSNVTTVAGDISNVNTVAGNNTNINTLAGINANVTTVAGVSSNVTTVAGSISNVNTVASNISSVNDFADKYRIASSAPSSNNDEGDLYYNTSTDTLYIYNGSAWQAGVTDISGLTTDSELAAWAGTTNITTLGTIGTGTWQGTAIAAGYIGTDAVGVAQLSASGTASSSTFLRGDNSWQSIDLTALNASNLTSGTVPDARFPATLPAASGVNLTALNASNLGSGTVPTARIPTLNQNTSGTSAGLTGTLNITVGVVTASSLDISGDVDIDGTLETDGLTIDGVTLTETIADTVGTMVTSNTETGITVTYNDSDNTLDFVIGTLNQDTTGTSGGFTAGNASNLNSGTVPTARLGSGTASNTTYLRGDNTWQTVSVSDTTYSVSCVDGDNTDEEKIRLTDSSGNNDDVVLEAGTGLSIARSGDKITFTNTVSDTNTTYSAGTGLSLSSTTFSLGNHSGDLITSGTIGTARLGSGSASSSTYLRGDGSWQSVGTSTGETYVKLNDAGSASNSGQQTIAGYQAGNSLTSGSTYNSMYGYQCGKDITSGDWNTLFGHSAGKALNTTAEYNTMFGAQAGEALGGTHNTLFGSETAKNLTSTSVDGVTCIGSQAGQSATNNSTYIGKYAGRSNTGTGNTVVGSTALTATGGGYNVAIGKGAMESNEGSSCVAIGYETMAHGTSSSESNVAIGHYAMAVTSDYTSTKNTALGVYSLNSLTDGDKNIAAGYQAGRYITTGEDNTCLGHGAAGYWNGTQLTTGSNNILIGKYAEPTSATVSNEITLGDTNITKFRIPGINFSIKDTTATDNYVLTVDSNGDAGWEAAPGRSTGELYVKAKDDSGNASDSGENTYAGYESGTSLASGAEENAFYGSLAGEDQTTGNANTLIGFKAGKNITTGGHNIALGHDALYNSTTSNSAIGIGTNAGGTGTYSIGIGQQAGVNSTGDDNVYIGYQTGGKDAPSNSSSGHSNVGIGREALHDISSGDKNIAIGYLAGDKITTGDNNILIGNEAYASSITVSNEITLGNDNTTKFRIPGINFELADNGGTPTNGHVLTMASGGATWAAAAGGIDSDAQYNVLGGSGAGTNLNSSAERNTLFGHNAGNNLTDGDDNTVFGSWAFDAGNGNRNTIIGLRAGSDMSGADDNVAVGYDALTDVTTADYNTAVGSTAGKAITTGDYNTLIGNNAGRKATTATKNVALGNGTLGAEASASTTGEENVAIGQLALCYLQSGDKNVGIGQYALMDVTTGNNNVGIGTEAGGDLTTGKQNVFIGNTAGKYISTSDDNVAIGHESLVDANGTGIANNTCLGTKAGKNINSNGNTVIGYEAGQNIDTGWGNTCIGYNAQPSSGTVDEEITLGRSGVTALRCNVTSITSLSDRRDKTDINTLDLGLDFINALKPVKFKWASREGIKVKDGTYEAGFIAQDFQQVQKDKDADYLKLVLDSNPDKLEASPGKLIPILVKAIQELSTKISILEQKCI